jgi:hypothetical protein
MDTISKKSAREVRVTRFQTQAQISEITSLEALLGSINGQ